MREFNVRADLRKYYSRRWRTITRPEVLRRAGGVFGDDGLYQGGARCARCQCPDIFPLSVWTRSQIDVAHLVTPPGQPGHDDPDNLAALCRKDHRAADYKEKDAERPILVYLQEERSFQVEATITASGYLELDAPDAETARKRVQELMPSIDFGFNWELDTTLFDSGADVHVDGVHEVEEEGANHAG
jgi:hypothetical protein